VAGDCVAFMYQWRFSDQCTAVGIPVLHASTRHIPYAKIDISLIVEE